MINLPAVLTFNEDEIVPVRAILFVTGHLTALDVAILLADPKLDLTTHVLDTLGGSLEMRSNDWKRIGSDLKSQETAGYQTSTRDQLELLPNSTFVYWDSLWRVYESLYLHDRENLTLENYTPVELANFELHRNANMPEDLIDLVFEGFNPAPVAALSSQAISNLSPSDRQPNFLATKDIAQLFDGRPYTAEYWPKRLSNTKWLQPAKRALGVQGGATALWCPLELAQLVHGREKSQLEKNRTIKALDRLFKKNPVLAPWLNAWDEYFLQFIDADPR